MMNSLQIPDKELVSIHRYVELRRITVTGDGWEELSEVKSACDALDGPQRLSFLAAAGSSCVSEVVSALQALEVGLLQDAVDLQVGHGARTASPF